LPADGADAILAVVGTSVFGKGEPMASLAFVRSSAGRWQAVARHALLALGLLLAFLTGPATAAERARLEAAVTAHRAALAIYTREAMPAAWAQTQNNLGWALRSLGVLTGDVTTLEAAVAAHRTALEVYSREATPVDRAVTQVALGLALSSLADASGDRQKGTEAGALYGEALEKWRALFGATLAGASDVSGLVTSMVRNYACMEIHNELVDRAKDYPNKAEAYIEEVTKSGTKVGDNPPADQIEFLFKNKLRTNTADCGSYQIPQPRRIAAGGQAGDGGKRAGEFFYTMHRNIFIKHKKDMKQLGTRIGAAFLDESSTAIKALETQDKLSKIIRSYRGDITKEIASQNANLGSRIANAFNSIEQHGELGWMAAGAWPLAITTTLQSVINSMETSMPTVRSPEVILSRDLLVRTIGEPKAETSDEKTYRTIIGAVDLVMREADVWIATQLRSGGPAGSETSGARR
jgi:tetratricopeptide (TPR) repeat protein